MNTVQIRLFFQYLLLPAIVLWAFSVSAQDTKKNSDQIYGFDPLLYNGRVYYFYPQPGTGGSQYLFDSFDESGSITVRGVTYTNLALNYDIYNQQFILKFKNAIGSNTLIQVSFAWLEKASLGGSNFEVVTDANSSKRLYQVIGNGREKIMIYRSKELLIDNLKSSRIHYFSEGKKDMFLMTNDQLISFKNNRALVKAFDISRQSFIKNYIRKQRINVRTASDLSITDLINYCNTLSAS